MRTLQRTSSVTPGSRYRGREVIRSLTFFPTLITRDYNSHSFVFREDGYFNMTKAAAHFGKRLDHFMASPDTKSYVTALSPFCGDKEVVSIRRGSGLYQGTGTWAHPKLAVFFARWLDVKFAVWCDMMISHPWRMKTSSPRRPR